MVIIKVFLLTLALIATVECKGAYTAAKITKKAPATTPNIIQSIYVSPQSQSKVAAYRSPECPTYPCAVQQGQKMSFQMDFIPAKSHNGVTAKVTYETNHAKVPGITYKVPTYVEKGQEYTFTMEFIVTKYPEGPSDFYLDLVGSDDGAYEIGAHAPFVMKGGVYP